MIRKSLLVISVMAIFLVGCGAAPGTSYRKYDDGGLTKGIGYSDFEISKNKYKVSYTGGIYSSTNEVMQFTYKRAKELCQENGFQDYSASNANTSMTSTLVFGQQANQVTYAMDIECKN